MMYAMNVGIEALQGKRGSNLWKDAFKDTAIMASLQGFAPEGTEDSLKLPSSHMQKKTDFSKKPPNWWDKAAGIFKSDVPIKDAAGQITMQSQTDPVKVGLGSIGLGAGLYGAGAFDPVDPPEPKYPGYNKFYAQNPGQFMPYDDPDIDPIDYSNYPDKPYSNIKEGGIIGLQGGGEPKQVSPQELFNKVMMEGYIPTSEEKEIIRVFLESNKAQGGIATFARGGRASNQPNQSIIEATNEEESRRLRQLGISHHDPELSPQEVIPRGGPQQGTPRIPYGQEEGSNGGIGGYGPGRSVAPEGTFSPTPQIDPRWFHPDNPRFLRPDVQGVKAGALIHRLPSKTKVDENNPKNYKRTSGKLVVDKAGKGSENKDTMLAQLADGEFVTKSKAVRGAGLALGANPKDKKQQKDLGARYFYKQMAEFDKLAKQMAS